MVLLLESNPHLHRINLCTAIIHNWQFILPDVFGKGNALLGNEFVWVCWSVNLPKSHKERDRAANVSQNSRSIRCCVPQSGPVPKA